MRNSTPLQNEAGELRSPLLPDRQTDEDSATSLVKKKKKKTSTRGFWDIYRFADKLDILLVTIGFICAIGNGCVQPMLSVVLGQVFVPPVTEAQIKDQ